MGTPTSDSERISAVVRDVNKRLVEAATREELESDVCSVLAGSDPYVFTWIGEHDVERGEIVPRAAAGVGEDYLEAISISTDDPASRRGPTATAVRTGELQAMQNIRENPDYEPWREQAIERGYESSAAIPLVSEAESYGVLNVYAARPCAFDETERQLLAELGETIANAIAGIEAREALQRRKEQYQRLTERVSDAYYAVDDEWRVTYWNDQMAARTGVPREAILGESLWEQFPVLNGTEVETNYRAAMETGSSRSFEAYLDEPYEYWVEIDVYPDENGLSVFSREITERKEREQALRETTETLEAVIGASPDAILMIDESYRITLWNRAATEMFGWEPSEVIDRELPAVFDGDLPAFRELIDRLEDGESITGAETRFDPESGDAIDMSISAARVDDESDLVGYMAIVSDVTERKAYERRLEEQNEKLGVLNRIVRHDVRNDMQFVLAMANRLRDRVDDDLADAAEQIVEHANHVVELTTTMRQLVELTLRDEECHRHDSVSLSGALERQLDDVRSAYSDAIIQTTTPIPQVSVRADETLGTVFRNLLKNAVQHSDKALPEIEISVAESPDTVTVSVADNGPGIPDDRKRTVFGKDEKGLDSTGTGIGLYLVNSLVESYGGDVWIEDNEPRGTVVRVKLRKAA
jgi:PAS domain S-box-containing protein